MRGLVGVREGKRGMHVVSVIHIKEFVKKLIIDNSYHEVMFISYRYSHHKRKRNK